MPDRISGQATSQTALASALPLREAGTRSRAGNAMARTRAGLLEGALRAVTQHGARGATMHDIAASAGIAKATLYNHIRTKHDVLSALVEAEVHTIAGECVGLSLVDALTHVAYRLSTHPALRQVAATDPAVLAALLSPHPDAPALRAARDEVRSLLAGRRGAGEDLVLRWLSTYLGRPADPAAIRAVAELVVRALPASPAP